MLEKLLDKPNYRPEAYRLSFIENGEMRAKEIQDALDKAFDNGSSDAFKKATDFITPPKNKR